VNIYSRSLRDRTEINFEVFFSKMEGRFSLRDEIRYKFMGFGVNTENSVFEHDYPVPIDNNVGTMPLLSKEPISVFSPFTPDQYERFGKP
jgi:hypothetical protein